MFRFKSSLKSYFQIIIIACVFGYSSLILASLACNDDGLKIVENIDQDPTGQYETVTILDGMGNEVVFTSPPQRIVAYDSAAVEILFALGEGSRIIGTHDFVEHPKEANNIKKLGSAFEINVETILSLDPDLVFLFSPTFLDDLRGAGINVLYVPNRNSGLESTAEDFLMWGRITGNVNSANLLAQDFIERVNHIRDKLAELDKGPKVFRDEGDLWTPGPNTLIGEAMSLLKLENIAYDVSGFEQLSAEILIERNPEIIIKTDYSTIESDPVFDNVIAIKEKNVFMLPDSPLSVAGPRFISGVEELARLIYPEKFY
jgi:iron complex transport system substrate-binding protein